jgi:dimethylhistidine N-methyltransferase
MTETSLCNLHIENRLPPAQDFLQEVLHGLRRNPKQIHPKFLWDKRGMELFNQICATEDYYIFRAETDILQTYGDPIAQAIGACGVMIELGSGGSKKIKPILRKVKPRSYIAFDISMNELVENAEELAQECPWIDVRAICGDYTTSLYFGDDYKLERRVAYFGGSTIGNFDPQEAISFLQDLRFQLGEHGGLLVGVDLKKDPVLLHRAFNDRYGITASFNLNLLRRLRCELGGKLDCTAFAHHAFYNEEHGRLEAHIRSLADQEIAIGREIFSLKKGELIHVENSYKYSVPEFRELSSLAGYYPQRVWYDAHHLFSLHFLTLMPPDTGRSVSSRYQRTS